ncbi:MAG: hypothetical protein EXX96DRAFT_508852 [Benjaminiella poitrasii]|nr:MAG: hypothetical protein EXX96DRAFT_508852 [Benjaminiella poitrasii]
MSERQSKAVQGKHERILNEIAKKPGNETCADCGAKNPRWASYSLGIFLCIRCAGIHRKMGTHISKVKSITMDQWTMEQIETMRNAGGNDVVNSKINPNPGSHPRPLAADDEHAMEKYIRAKWEKRSFMSEKKDMALSSVKPAARLTIPPKRSSSVPTFNGGNTTNLVPALNQLREMGFQNEAKNKQILIQTQGNVQSAIEMLWKSTDEQKMEQLIKLGFTDRNSNTKVLKRAGGNVNVAVAILNEESKKKVFAGQTSSLLIDVDFTPATTATTTTTNNPFFTATNHNQMVSHQPQLPVQPQYQQNGALFNNNNNPFGNNGILSASTSSPTTTLFTPNPQPTSTSFNPFSQMVTNTATNNYNPVPSYFQQQQQQQQQQYPVAPSIQQQQMVSIPPATGLFTNSPFQQQSIFQPPQQPQQQPFWPTNSLF